MFYLFIALTLSSSYNPGSWANQGEFRSAAACEHAASQLGLTTSKSGSAKPLYHCIPKG